MHVISAQLSAVGLRFGLVVSRFNDFLTNALLGGARDCLVRHGASDDDLTAVWVPGANEIPLVVHRMAKAGGYDALIGLGCVIQGETPHADLIGAQVERSLAQIGMDFGLPVINGVLLTRTLDQAIERSGTKAGNRGWAAAQAAIEMAQVLRLLQAPDQ